LAARSIEPVSARATRASSSANKYGTPADQYFRILNNSQVNFAYFEIEAIVAAGYLWPRFAGIFLTEKAVRARLEQLEEKNQCQRARE
jgi:hypothetical protein